MLFQRVGTAWGQRHGRASVWDSARRPCAGVKPWTAAAAVAGGGGLSDGLVAKGMVWQGMIRPKSERTRSYPDSLITSRRVQHDR